MNQLAFKSLEGENYISIWRYGSPRIKYFTYRIGQDGEWTGINSQTKIPLSGDTPVYFRSKDEYCNNKDDYYFFHIDGEGKVEVQGNINSLINDSPKLPSYAFYKLFQCAYPLVKASKLNLNFERMSKGCFQQMFENCGYLQEAPQLPCQWLAQDCYFAMFRQCVSLVKPPSQLPADNLYKRCYGHMFEKCIRIKNTPIIQTTHPYQESCHLMFAWCSSLTGVVTNFEDWNTQQYIPTDNWLLCVPKYASVLSGNRYNCVFYKKDQLEEKRGKNYIPRTWCICPLSTYNIIQEEQEEPVEPIDPEPDPQPVDPENPDEPTPNPDDTNDPTDPVTPSDPDGSNRNTVDTDDPNNDDSGNTSDDNTTTDPDTGTNDNIEP